MAEAELSATGARDEDGAPADEPAAAVPADDAAAQAQAALAAMQAAGATTDQATLDMQQVAASIGLNAEALIRQLTGALNGGGGGEAPDLHSVLRTLTGGADMAVGASAAANALSGTASFNNLLDNGAGALGQQLTQQLGSSAGDALAALAAQMQAPAVGNSAMLASLGLPPDPFVQLQSLGLKYQAFMDAKDTQLLEQARRTHNVMQLTVQVLQVPAGISIDGVMPAVQLELPGAADLACLKRAINRASGGLLAPHSQRYFVSETGQPMSGDSNLLLSWDLSSGSQLYLVVVEHEPAHSLRVHQVSASGMPRSLAAVVVAEDDSGGGLEDDELALLRRAPLGYPGGSEDGDDESRRRALGKLPATKKPKSDAGGEASAPRTRFSEEEIQAVVEGVRMFGTSWARIKNTFATQLARRTQVNIKDKWRNLQRGLQTNWRDERSHLSEETKEKIRQLDEALKQQYGGMPAGLPLLPDLSSMHHLAAPHLAALAQQQLAAALAAVPSAAMDEAAAAAAAAAAAQASEAAHS